MNIKVCGITLLKQLQQLEGMDIDFAGFILSKSSPRYAGVTLSKKDVKAIEFDIKKVGVFVNQERDEILQAIDEYALDVVQLHGEETPYLCEEISEEVEVIKAFCIGDDTNIDKEIEEYDDVCDYYLFDTKSGSDIRGGLGKKFDWNRLAKSKIEKPFFLGGGIGKEDAAKIKAIKHPDFFGVDVNSLFEKEPGVKDMALILQFKLALKKR